MRKAILIGVALALAFAGTGAAASRWLITSTHQIKPSVLHQLHGARGAAGSRGVTGPTGPTGATGAPGATGPAGGFSTSNVVEEVGPEATMCAAGGGSSCQVQGSTAFCPAGSVVLGGGWSGGSNPPVEGVTVSDSQPLTAAWLVVMTNTGPVTASFSTYAVCAVGSGAHAARVASGGQRSAIAAARKRLP